MSIRFPLLFSFLFVILLSGSAFAQTPPQGPPLKKRVPEPAATPVTIPTLKSITLDKETLIKCEPGMTSKSRSCSRDMSVKVQSFAINPRDNSLSFRCFKSGGNLVRCGANMLWELNNVKPGSYNITVEVYDPLVNSAVGTSLTKTIEVRECSDCCVSASKILIESELVPILTGYKLILTASPNAGDGDETFVWKLNGKKIDGKNLQRIIVEESSEIEGKNLEVETEMTSGCNGESLTQKKTISVAVFERQDLNVIVKDPNKPLSGVTVELSDNTGNTSRQTDANGQTTFKNILANRSYKVTVRVDLYEPNPSDQSVELMPERPVTVTFKLKKKKN